MPTRTSVITLAKILVLKVSLLLKSCRHVSQNVPIQLLPETIQTNVSAAVLKIHGLILKPKHAWMDAIIHNLLTIQPTCV
jgi:hypothetical protein